MSELSQLIQINKNIEKQNEEIIRLLKVIACEKQEGENSDKSVIDLGELYLEDDASFEAEPKEGEIENLWRVGSLLDNSIDVGEVYFIEGTDIFRLSVKNNETSIDNLTGDGQANIFALEETIANESVKNNKSLEDSTVILSSEHSQNLPETLKICVEQGAKKVYMHLFASSQLVGAPQSLMELIKFDFYKNNEHLVEKLFK
ncbi:MULTISPECIES: hypothetical protein [Methanobrevibacter]|uniref:Uncharacterized protein n=1 Tax=Methanobrevibacter gottschalkii DSM 11977 TaxID=1122229 RepID=A0A3N5C6F6_9EURY|nr:MULTISPECIES: hypothetical protein [Methanobrevibacter]OEC97278.1 hypothetical protein A9505_05540 [Methanobrevibacter sp. A27]RPF51991.1 hypothetical protein EDC42_1335 [Methanobrevibacter gottschalkii DSM 11977]